jgi:hypothetical protein
VLNGEFGPSQSITTIGTFLQPDYHGPEQEALQKLIEAGELIIRPEAVKRYRP